MGKGATVGSLKVNLGLDSAEFKSGIAESTKDAAKFSKDLKSGMTSAAGHVSSAAAGMKAALIGIGFAGFTASVTGAVNSLATLGDEAKRSGVSIQAFQEWKFVAEQNRIGIDQMTDGLKELNLRADEFALTGKGSAAEAFQRLGYSADEVTKKLIDPSELLLEIIGRLGQFDKAAQIRISDELFGGSAGERFVELIDQGEAGLRKTIDRAHELGAVLDDDVVKNAAEINRQFNEIAKTISVTLQGAIVRTFGIMSTAVDMLNREQDQQLSTLKTRVAGIDAAVANARKSSMALFAIGGEEGLNQRLKERADLLERISALENGAPTKITVNGDGSGWTPPDYDPNAAASAQKAEREQEAMAARLEAFRVSLMSEEEAERFSHEKRLEELRTYLDARMITQAEFNTLGEEQHKQHAERLAEITRENAEKEARIREQLVGHVGDLLGSLATLSEQFGDKGLAAAKAFGIAQAIINTAEGITKALAQGGMLGFAGAAAVAAAGVAQIATIARTNKGSSSRPSVSSSAVSETSSDASTDSAAGGPATYLTIQGEMFSRESVEDLMRQMVELQRDGHKLILQ